MEIAVDAINNPYQMDKTEQQPVSYSFPQYS